MTYTVVCSADDRAAWLAARRTGVGASEVPALLGCVEWQSPLSLWAEKRATEPPEEREPSEAMRMGTLLEPVIVAEVARRAGVALVPGPQQMLRSAEHPWATATPDAMTADGEPVEVKCLLHSYSEAAWAAGIPERYALQVQHQMLVTGASRCLFGALVPAFGKVTVVEDPYAVVVNAEPIWEWVPRDEHAIRRIIYRGSKFWQQVESGEEPASCGTPHDRAALSARVDLAGEPVELSGPEVADALADYHREEARLAELRECVRHTEREQGKALDRLASLMGSAPAGITPGGVRVEWRETHRKSYTVQASTSRSLRIVTPKEK